MENFEVKFGFKTFSMTDEVGERSLLAPCAFDFALEVIDYSSVLVLRNC